MLPKSKEMHRLRLNANLSVAFEDGRFFNGIVRDMSATGLCGFLVCPDPSALTPGTPLRITAAGGGGSIGPLRAEAVVVEPSFVSGFDLVVICKFKPMNEEDQKLLEEFIETNKIEPEEEMPEKIESESLDLVNIENADVVQFVFPARFAYVAHFREACKKLAEEAGFEEFDCQMIKIVADEIFSNALHHGSDVYGGSRIHARIVVGRGAIGLCVRDHCGKPFDYRKYRKLLNKSAPAMGTGLNLVHRLVDNWAVKIEPGRFTEVCAFKRKMPQASNASA